MKFSIFCLIFFWLASPLNCFAGSLTVGTKVIYPGGTDQPPKEKDTGVSLNAEIAGTADVESEDQLDLYRRLLEEGDYQTLLENVENNDNPEFQTLKALALYYSDEEDAALKLAKKLLINPNLSQEAKTKLCEEMAIEMPENQEDSAEKTLEKQDENE